MRRRVIDAVLVIAAVVGTVWLGYLIYHNHFGGHVERAESSWEGDSDTPAIGGRLVLTRPRVRAAVSG